MKNFLDTAYGEKNVKIFVISSTSKGIITLTHI